MDGDIPPVLDIPTGLGKTKVIAIWLAALSSGAQIPRRLVYVVDRRAVVDQASGEAQSIAEIYRQTTGNDIAISTLRGQHVDSPDWREDPSRPAIVVGTVDMIGSRLLFEGYGVSRRMRPLHAGLLGVDALLVLDEAHLVPPFQALIEAVSTDPALAGAEALPLRRLRLMSLSATQRGVPSTVTPFRLGDEDRTNEEVARRLGAAKRLVVLEAGARKSASGGTDPAALAEALAREAIDLAEAVGGPARIVVYCDRREVAERTERHLAGRATILFVGARRVHERQAAAKELESAGFMSGTERPEATCFLIATAAGEVGVDLDADHAVMDLVSWERMVQRLGRVNRLGRGTAMVRVVDPGLTTSPSGASLDAVRRLIERLPTVDGGVQAGPGALDELAAGQTDLVREGTSPAPLRPALSRALVDAWALTGLREHTGRPEVEPWLRGWVEVDRQTRIVWRAHLPRREQPAVKDPEVEAFFDHARPHLSEVLETETHRAREWLHARAKAHRASEAGADRDHIPIAFLLDRDGSLRRTVTLTAAAAKLGKQDALQREMEGRTLVVDAMLGGLTKAGLLDKDSEEATTADGADPWEVGFSIVARPPETDPAGGAEVDGAPEVEATEVSDTEAAGAPATGEVEAAYRFVTRFSAEDEPEAWLDIFLTDHEDTDGDAPSRASQPVFLNEHQAAVETEIRRIAGRLGLDPHWVELLATAARLHDEGKAAPVWQIAMNAPRDGRPYAKTRGGNGRRLEGYRHEFGSLFAAQRDPAVQAMDADDRDLVLHLIAAHHGGARPAIGVEGCAEGPPSAMAAVGLEVALRHARLQKRWGPWGLAWWESLLRAADQAVSKGGG